MRNRFDFDYLILNGPNLRTYLNETYYNGRIPIKYENVITSFELIRMKDNLDILKNIEAKYPHIFQMVIIDEAHKMRNSNTLSNELGNILSNLTEMMLLLSATPLNLKSEDLFNQLHILNPKMFPDIETFNQLQKPQKLLNKLRQALMSTDNKVRRKLIDEIEENTLSKTVFSDFGFIDLINKLKSDIQFSDEDILDYEELIVSSSPLYYSFTRTRKREAIEKQVTRDVKVIPIDLDLIEINFMEKFLSIMEEYYSKKG